MLPGSFGKPFACVHRLTYLNEFTTVALTGCDISNCKKFVLYSINLETTDKLNDLNEI